MPRIGPDLTELEDRVYRCVAGSPGGLPYGKLLKQYMTNTTLHIRQAKAHLRKVRFTIEKGELPSLSTYRGPAGLIFGSTSDEVFTGAKEDAERPPLVDRPPGFLQLGGVFQNSPFRTEWTHCPETNKIVRSTIVTMGVADFMECQVCNRAHFLGVSPKLQHQRLYAWQVDPLVNSEDYADVLTRNYMGDPVTLRAQESQLDRIRMQRGHYVGLWFRSSWTHDPNNEPKVPDRSRKAELALKKSPQRDRVHKYET
jgi:hypothetical protein